MALERTFSIIKPDATKRNLVGQIVAKLEEGGLRVVAQKRIHLTAAQAGVFYAVHKERPFYDELCEFMSSEPIVVQVLEGEKNALVKRDLHEVLFSSLKWHYQTLRSHYCDGVLASFSPFDR